MGEEPEAKKASADVETSNVIHIAAKDDPDQIAAREKLALMIEEKGW